MQMKHTYGYRQPTGTCQRGKSISSQRKSFDPFFYGAEVAKELDTYASELATETHSYAIKSKVDDREALGASGNFNSVTKSLPIPLLLETKVCGPVFHRQLAKKQQESIFHLDKDYILSYSCDSTSHPDSEKQKTNATSTTRDQIEFISELDSIDPEIQEDSPTSMQRPLPDYIGCQIKVHNKANSVPNEGLNECGTVREQLSGRLIKIEKNSTETRENGSNLTREDGINTQDYFRSGLKCSDVTDKELARQRDSALRDFAELYRSASEQSSSSARNAVEDRNNSTNINLKSLSKKIKRKISLTHAKLKNEARPGKQEMNEVLIDAIDTGDTFLMKSALDLGASVHHQGKGGKDAFQIIFTRLCRVDSGHEPRKWTKLPYERMLTEIFCRGADINRLDCPHKANGWAPIHYAVTFGNLERVQYLVGCNAKLDIKCFSGETPLMMTCERGNFEIAYYLVKENANLREMDNNKLSVLHYAAKSGNKILVKFLVECGCIYDKLKACNNGETPISLCKVRNFYDCAEYLEKVPIPKQLKKPFIDDLVCRQAKFRVTFINPKKQEGRKKSKRREQTDFVSSLSHSAKWKKNWSRILIGNR